MRVCAWPYAIIISGRGWARQAERFAATKDLIRQPCGLPPSPRGKAVLGFAVCGSSRGRNAVWVKRSTLLARRENDLRCINTQIFPLFLFLQTRTFFYENSFTICLFAKKIVLTSSHLVQYTILAYAWNKRAVSRRDNTVFNKPFIIRSV